MKKTFVSLVALLMASAAFAQTTNLPAPNKSKKTASMMEALANRRSQRAFSKKELSQQELSDLLWATCGVSSKDGKITSPTAMNKQEIRLFVFSANDVREYLPKTNQLKTVAQGDNRAIVANGQDFTKDAPVVLVLVADLDKFGSTSEHAVMMAAVDTGIASENINLYCAATGLATVTRGTMDQAAIKKLLKLSDNQIPLINNPVGYPAK